MGRIGGSRSGGHGRRRLPGEFRLPIAGWPKQELLVDLGDARFVALVREEIGAVLAEGFRGLRLHRLADATIERKRRRGCPTPATPMYDTGALERSLELVDDGGELRVVCNDYMFKQLAGRFEKFSREWLPRVNAALHRALARFIADAVR